MLILTIRTDKPEAEIGLYSDNSQLTYVKWEANRQLAETINSKIKDILAANSVELKDLNALAIYEGPGSFTGLRIGFSVANALADGLHIPITTTTGDDWINTALEILLSGKGQQLVLPEYGSPPHITKPKH